MPQLVALDLRGGRAFTRALEAVWEAGHAVAPLDRRLPPAARTAAIASLRPSRVVGPDGETTALDDGLPVEDGDALVLLTSGSGGEPRAVVLTHRAVEASARATSARLGVDPARHRWLACLPLAHVGGLSVLTRSLVTGTPCTVLDGFDAEQVTCAARRDGVTHVSLVATALARVDADLFECILLGGAAPPDALPANVVTTYGMTETGSGIVYDGEALDGVELAIGSGRPGEGEEHEILVRAPMCLRAYRDGTHPFVAGPDGRGGWLPTGDAGELGAGGILRVDGRLADVVVTGGEKVWPAAVERVLAAHRGVAQVAVWRRPDPEWGQRVVAWVVPAESSAPPTLDELAEAVRAVLAPWSAPKELVLVDRLPRTPSGKVRRRDLA